MIEAYREFIREQTPRFERAMRVLAAQVEDNREQTRLHREESRRYFERIDKRLDDLHDQSRAQTQALLHVIDRPDNGGAAPAG